MTSPERPSWRSNVETYLSLIYFETTEDLPDYRSRLNAIEYVDVAEEVGLWTHFKIQHPLLSCHGALYRKRLVLYITPDPWSIIGLELIISRGLSLSKVFDQIADEIGAVLFQQTLQSVRSYFLVQCGSLRGDSARFGFGALPSWLNDGLTTFYARVHDSQRGRVGYIRISRHLGITFGLGRNLFQDLANIVYEEFLYQGEEIDARMVFKLFDALGDYVLPMELNLYLQKIFYGLGLFAALLSITLVYLAEVGSIITSAVPPSVQSINMYVFTLEMSSLAVASVKYILLLGVVFFVWFLVRRIVFAVAFK